MLNGSFSINKRLRDLFITSLNILALGILSPSSNKEKNEELNELSQIYIIFTLGLAT